VETENLYVQRINLVINHIRQHLTDDLSLETLARVAAFSPFHFHRIFKTLTSETLNDTVTRLRLERAAALLKTSPEMKITDAALACGFASSSTFSRAFRQHFGRSARTWDRQTPLQESKNRKVFDEFPQYTVEVLSDVEQTGEFDVQIRSLPAQRMAFNRVFTSFQAEPMISGYQRLLDWYRSQGGDPAKATLYGMSQDDPDITPVELYRYDFCFAVPDAWKAAGEIGIQDFPGCQIASIHCQGDIYLVSRAWQYLYRYWFPNSRYQPDNLPAMEIYHRQPAELGWEIYDLECAVPIVSL
jgi:AraC family transcriptional regulator